MAYVNKEKQKAAQKRYYEKNKTKLNAERKQKRLDNLELFLAKEKIQRYRTQQSEQRRLARNKCRVKSYHKHKKEILAKCKQNRIANIEEYKTKEKFARNKKQAKIKAKQNHDKRRDNLTDSYIRNIMFNAGATAENITPEMIEIKRLSIQLKRETKNAKIKQTTNP